MEAARHLQPLPAFDRETGEVTSYGCEGCAERQDQIDGLLERVSSLEGVRTKLKREVARVKGVAPGNDQVREVLEHAREATGRTAAKIIPGSPAWKKVEDRLADVDVEGQKVFTVEDLKLAATGVMLSSYHVENGFIMPETIFRDAGTTTKHRARALWAIENPPKPAEKAAKHAEERGLEKAPQLSPLDRVSLTLAREWGHDSYELARWDDSGRGELWAHCPLHPFVLGVKPLRVEATDGRVDSRFASLKVTCAHGCLPSDILGELRGLESRALQVWAMERDRSERAA